MSEPRTKAGRMLLKTYSKSLPPAVLDAYILAIEAQAAAPSEDALCFSFFQARHADRAVRCDLAPGHDGKHSFDAEP